MTEIKFRAWSKPKKLIRPVSKIDFLGKRVFVTDKKGGEFVTPWPLCDSVLLQYTGLKDKNGVEIYEGDILVRYRGKEYESIRQIVYDKGSFVCVVRWPHEDGPYAPLQFRTYDANIGEVIGNIYENPELMEAK